MTKGRGPSCAGLRPLWWWAAINYSFECCGPLLSPLKCLHRDRVLGILPPS
jgi:hypothetical protein